MTDLSFKILDPSNSGIVDIGHFSFLGSESSLTFRAQIIDNDDNGNAYYVPGGGTVDLTFPVGITVPANIEPNRSLVNVILTDTQLGPMITGDLAGTVTIPPSIVFVANLGNSIRRLTVPAAPGPGGAGGVTGKVRANSADGTAGYLGDELVVAGGLTKDIIFDPVQGNVVRLTALAGSELQTLTNNSGVTIPQARCVKLTADDEIAFADNTSIANAKGVGITLESINHLDSGSVIVDGVISVTLGGVNSGDILFLDSSNGQLTTSAPTAPGSAVFKVGDYNSGKIYLRLELVGVN